MGARPPDCDRETATGRCFPPSMCRGSVAGGGGFPAAAVPEQFCSSHKLPLFPGSMGASRLVWGGRVALPAGLSGFISWTSPPVSSHLFCSLCFSVAGCPSQLPSPLPRSPSPSAGASGTALEDTGKCSLSLCTCQIPAQRPGATLPGCRRCSMAREPLTHQPPLPPGSAWPQPHHILHRCPSRG